jgi:predicted  nucleic acid-binding Zn-ribbon protein
METENQLHSSILKELSDIKANLAVNSNETSNIRQGVSEIKSDVRETRDKVAFQNGRVTKLEQWANEAKAVIESTTKIASETMSNYKSDRSKIWTAVAVLLVVGGAVITLSIMAINTKIRDGIAEALSTYDKVIINNQ